ncbi:uncharacterized protein SPAPADRAFT_58574 [Spathaspora passalidarum NRRL Y-27907]|uniref:Uncharacterized protein n=1 Tax=Spathaspora passalidarum (strain NRRL Y-27907 / 11-Y1) TaxID=619300 RepID=G3AGK8_SPAPN|nr:uncharacterized protein SPAPADRAFT_58574 [Spathaspora passalidarum NRRL Y-27907]EGW35347.1 hypothetical protein SPAPADRAFT_58574 [Spathaspora passalidarum NRRL Y-27907]
MNWMNWKRVPIWKYQKTIMKQKSSKKKKKKMMMMVRMRMVGILEIFDDDAEEEEEEDDDEDDDDDDDEEEEEVYEYDLLEQDDQGDEDEYDLLEEEDSESEDNGVDDESVVLQNIQICLTQDMIKCDQDSENSESNVTSCNIPTVSYTPSCHTRKRNHQEMEENKDKEPVVEEPPTKKKRSSVIKTIAKEIGKGLFYAIATITALGIYGHSLERQDQSD